MTDLSKGIVEINGFEIASDTTSFDIKSNLEGIYTNCATSKSGKVEIFTFKDVNLLGRRFDVDITFIRQKISDITLYSCFADNVSYDDRFNDDCEWLKNILGEPHDVLNHTNSYHYNGVHIYSFIERDLSRNPADTHITCNYEG